MQAASDILLGWVHSDDEVDGGAHDFYVRELWGRPRSTSRRSCQADSRPMPPCAAGPSHARTRAPVTRSRLPPTWERATARARGRRVRRGVRAPQRARPSRPRSGSRRRERHRGGGRLARLSQPQARAAQRSCWGTTKATSLASPRPKLLQRSSSSVARAAVGNLASRGSSSAPPAASVSARSCRPGL
jgi:hypothetical protein